MFEDNSVRSGEHRLIVPSVLFYRRPDYLSPSNGPINGDACMRYVERAKSKL
jgi:hypothetical protein